MKRYIVLCTLLCTAYAFGADSPGLAASSGAEIPQHRAMQIMPQTPADAEIPQEQINDLRETLGELERMDANDALREAATQLAQNVRALRRTAPNNQDLLDIFRSTLREIRRAPANPQQGTRRRLFGNE